MALDRGILQADGQPGHLQRVRIFAMRAFACPVCSALIVFENSVCVTCGTSIGFVRTDADFHALSVDSDGWYAYVDATGAAWRPCANLWRASCNWLAPSGAAAGLCSCCALTRTRPHDDDGPAMAAFARTESAKRRLLYQLDHLGLPTTPRWVDPTHGLAFDLLSSARQPVTTGHDSGVITIDLAEGDDEHREALRATLGEAYRTMLGHLRHEIGHWYWEELVERSPALPSFRRYFGDETQDYRGALAQHYRSPDSDGWRVAYVSQYASAHPWEDWAECFAHYLHMTDTLQTAAANGVVVTGPDLALSTAPNARLSVNPRESYTDFDRLVRAWLGLTYPLNAINRSMGKDDLYPFVLVPPVIEKLRFVHELVTAPR